MYGSSAACSLPNQNNLYFSNSFNNEPILVSMLAAGIVQDTFAGEAREGGEVEKTGGYFYHPGRKFFPFRSN